MVGILDSFHFDVSNTTLPASQEQRRDMKSGQDLESISEEKDTVSEEKYRGKEEKEGEAMEVEEEGEREEEEEEGCGLLSQSQLQQKIHNTIVQSILPSLEAILTKVYIILHLKMSFFLPFSHSLS